METETVKLSILDAMKLGVSWEDIANANRFDFYALREGLDKETFVSVPIALIKLA